MCDFFLGGVDTSVLTMVLKPVTGNCEEVYNFWDISKIILASFEFGAGNMKTFKEQKYF